MPTPFGREADVMDDLSAAMKKLGTDAGRTFVPRPMEWFVVTARRRRRRRLAGAVAAVVAVALSAIGFAVVANGGGRGDVTPPPAESPTSASASQSAPPPVSTPPTSSGPRSEGRAEPDIRSVDWRHATIVLPANPDDPGCPVGPVTTDGETTQVGDRRFIVRPTGAVGDLTGDGEPEAVVVTHCIKGEDSGDASGQLLVITRRDGQWRGLAYVGPAGENYQGATVSGNRLTATIQPRYGDRSISQQRVYRWNGTTFVQVAGPTAFPSPSRPG
jgi:hypothetical protein